MKDDLEKRCLYKSIKECLKKEYSSIGRQELLKGEGFEEYNCKVCGSTVSEESIVSHYVNNHYSLGIKKLRESKVN